MKTQEILILAAIVFLLFTSTGKNLLESLLPDPSQADPGKTPVPFVGPGGGIPLIPGLPQPPKIYV